MIVMEEEMLTSSEEEGEYEVNSYKRYHKRRARTDHQGLH